MLEILKFWTGIHEGDPMRAVLLLVILLGMLFVGAYSIGRDIARFDGTFLSSLPLLGVTGGFLFGSWLSWRNLWPVPLLLKSVDNHVIREDSVTVYMISSEDSMLD